MDRVLALSMRPKYLRDLVGQDKLREALLTQFESGRIPHFYIISGPVGAGKTTLARILALCLHVRDADFKDLTEEHWENYKQYDIQEINAADRNGIDDIRSLIEVMRFKPMPPSKVKVMILDEAHQLTVPAQNALLTNTEDVAPHVFYIFCTSMISKIIPALQRRAFIMTPDALTGDAMKQVIDRAVSQSEYSGDITKLVDALSCYDITSPGLILQAAEKYFAGISEIESMSPESSKINTMEICRAVVSGSWSKCTPFLKDVTKNDVAMVRNSLLGYLKTVLMQSSQAKAYRVAKAIQCISSSGSDEFTSNCLPLLIASICIGCEQLKASQTT